MLNKRITQIIYKSVYLVISIIGILFGLHAFESFDSETLQYNLFFFTNLSNYACVIYILIEFIMLIIKYCKGEKEGKYTLNYPIKFCFFISILLTFLVANTMLGDSFGYIFQAKYWENKMNVFMHLFMPLMYILDFIVLSNRHQMKWYYPFYSLIFPVIYLSIIFIRASLLPSTYEGMLYPYPFLNIEQLGIGNVILIIIGLCAIFLAIGFIYFGIDKIKTKKEKQLSI